jgi:hypothetical protein
MVLTAHQQALRAFKVTASQLPILMHGDDAAILKMYREDMGEIEREAPNYAMELGSHWEPFALDYCEKISGHPITRRGEVVDHPTIPEFCCTLDGYRSFDDAVIECKFLSPFWKREDFVPHYYPQLLAQVRCIGCTRGIFWVGQGTSEPVEIEIILDDDYEGIMWARVDIYRQCLRTFTPPVPMPRVVPRDQWRTVDLAQSPMPNWGHAILPMLRLFEDTRAAAEIHETVGKEARALVPDDVGVVLAGEHKLARNKRGTVSITRIAA